MDFMHLTSISGRRATATQLWRACGNETKNKRANGDQNKYRRRWRMPVGHILYNRANGFAINQQRRCLHGGRAKPNTKYSVRMMNWSRSPVVPLKPFTETIRSPPFTSGADLSTSPSS